MLSLKSGEAISEEVGFSKTSSYSLNTDSLPISYKSTLAISSTSSRVASTMIASIMVSIPLPEVMSPTASLEILSTSNETRPSKPSPSIALKIASSKTGKSLTV